MQELQDQNKLIYLASLYSYGIKDGDEAKFHQRYSRVLVASCKLLRDGYNIFSPIVHNHPINRVLKNPEGWDFWKPYDTNILGRCDYMFILADTNWEKSVGINGEIDYAREKGIPIYLLDMSHGDLKEIVYSLEKFK